MPKQHPPATERRRSTRLHRQPHIPSQQSLRVLPVERHLRSSSSLLHILRQLFGRSHRSRSHSPDHRQYHQSCTHRAPPATPTAAVHPTARVRRRLRPPACFVRGAGNSASRPAHPLHYTPSPITLPTQTTPHPSHIFH